MQRWQRKLAIALVGAVLWTVLMPVLGAVRESLAGEATPLCHQAGMQVDVASAPLPPAPGETPARDTHCPLCVMGFFVAFTPSIVVPQFVAIGRVPRLTPPALPAPLVADASPFLSRAPPAA